MLSLTQLKIYFFNTRTFQAIRHNNSLHGLAHISTFNSSPPHSLNIVPAALSIYLLINETVTPIYGMLIYILRAVR